MLMGTKSIILFYLFSFFSYFTERLSGQPNVYFIYFITVTVKQIKCKNKEMRPVVLHFVPKIHPKSRLLPGSE